MSSPGEPTGHEVTDQPGGNDTTSSERNVTRTTDDNNSVEGKSSAEENNAADAAEADDKTMPSSAATGVESCGITSASAGPAKDAPHALLDLLSEEKITSTPTKEKHAPKPLDLADHEAPEQMEASVATIRAPCSPSRDSAPAQYLTAEMSPYVDPTPATPMTSQPPSRSPSAAARSHRSDDVSPSRTDPDQADDEKRYLSEDEQDGGSRSEIQSIMEQFSEEGGGPGVEEVMSPRLEIASPMLGGPMQHPPRKSSLEPLSQSISNQLQDFSALRVSTSPPSSVRSKERAVGEHGPPVPPKDGTFGTPPRTKDERRSSVTSPTSPPHSMHRPPPPEPEPEPALPFDFHRFLEQLRNKKADPVARYLKSFLSEFGKKQWMVHEQVKIIGDFLAFIANKMMVCEVWRDVSDAEFDNAREGMEKLVMNRLYTQSFSPAIAPPKPIPGAKPRRRGGDVPLGPGRRGQHQEDIERDDILTQKINIYGWVKEEHLDIPAVGESGRRFLKLAQQGVYPWHNCSSRRRC